MRRSNPGSEQNVEIVPSGTAGWGSKPAPPPPPAPEVKTWTAPPRPSDPEGSSKKAPVENVFGVDVNVSSWDREVSPPPPRRGWNDIKDDAMDFSKPVVFKQEPPPVFDSNSKQGQQPESTMRRAAESVGSSSQWRPATIRKPSQPHTILKKQPEATPATVPPPPPPADPAAPTQSSPAPPPELGPAQEQLMKDLATKAKERRLQEEQREKEAREARLRQKLADLERRKAAAKGDAPDAEPVASPTSLKSSAEPSDTTPAKPPSDPAAPSSEAHKPVKIMQRPKEAEPSAEGAPSASGPPPASSKSSPESSAPAAVRPGPVKQGGHQMSWTPAPKDRASDATPTTEFPVPTRRKPIPRQAYRHADGAGPRIPPPIPSATLSWRSKDAAAAESTPQTPAWRSREACVSEPTTPVSPASVNGWGAQASSPVIVDNAQLLSRHLSRKNASVSAYRSGVRPHQEQQHPHRSSLSVPPKPAASAPGQPARRPTEPTSEQPSAASTAPVASAPPAPTAAKRRPQDAFKKKRAQRRWASKEGGNSAAPAEKPAAAPPADVPPAKGAAAERSESPAPTGPAPAPADAARSSEKPATGTESRRGRGGGRRRFGNKRYVPKGSVAPANPGENSSAGPA